jgi:small subunit ribosomal protein S4
LGDPKKARKRYSRPRNPWRADQLAQELYLVGNFGLRNKRELWKAETGLSSMRKQARTLLAATEKVRLKEEKKLLDSLQRRGLVAEGASLDDILSLTVEDVLGRRLQSMVFKRGMAISPLHARQLVTHGHVVIGERTVTVPGYGVSRREEGEIKLVGVNEPVQPEGPGTRPAEAPKAPEPQAAETGVK